MKDKILDTAEKLFMEKGFGSASTNDIIKELNISRGTLYYYFKTKEDILDEVINRIITNIVSKASSIAYDESTPVLKRLLDAMLSLNIATDLGIMIMDELHRPENALMHQKIEDNLIERVTPIITHIVDDGIKENIFKTEYPKETVEMILIYSNKVFSSDIKYKREDRIDKINAFIINVEKMLGANENSLKNTINKIIEGENYE